MDCVTKKKCYQSIEEAEEGLIQMQVKYNRGPVNFYSCSSCGCYHLTSKGERHPILTKEEVLKRISTEQQASHWIDRFKS